MKKLLSVMLLLIIYSFLSTAKAADSKKWTYLIYLPNSKNLMTDVQKNIIELERVGSNEDVNVVVQLGSTTENNSVRMLLQKKRPWETPNRITSPILEDLGVIDTGDYHRFEDFIAWGIKNFPAEHYFIEISGHGSGWIEPVSPFHDLPVTNLAIGYDRLTSDFIATKELAEALRYAKGLIGHNVDIYGSDACEMGQIEVAAELADSVDIMIGSQDTTPDHGWNYEAILNEWESLKDPDAKHIAKLIVKHNFNYYKSSPSEENSYTISAFDLSKMPLLTKAVAELSKDLFTLTYAERKEVMEMGRGVLFFSDMYNADLVDFMNKLAVLKLPTVDPQHIADIITAKNEVVIANGGFNGGQQQPGGVSILYPVEWEVQDERYLAQDYPVLQFAAETQWGKAVHYIWYGV